MQTAVEELCQRSGTHPELEKFRVFHRQHPEVLDFLVTEYRVLLKHKRQAFSFQSLFEYTRWKIVLRRTTATFKLNDHLAPWYGRIITILHPEEVNGLVCFRTSVADAVLGVQLAPAKQKGSYARALQWADGTPLELGWRPQNPHVVKHAAKRRPDTH